MIESVKMIDVPGVTKAEWKEYLRKRAIGDEERGFDLTADSDWHPVSESHRARFLCARTFDDCAQLGTPQYFESANFGQITADAKISHTLRLALYTLNYQSSSVLTQLSDTDDRELCLFQIQS